MAYDFELSSSQFIHWGDILDDVIAGADKKFTFAATIIPEGPFVVGQTFIAKYDEADNRQYEIAIASDAKVFITFVADGAAAQYAQVKGNTTTLVAGTLYRIVVSYDGSIDSAAVNRLQIWINGTLQSNVLLASAGAFPFDIPVGPAPLSVGCRKGVAAGGAQFFDGVIQEPAIWSGLFTADDAGGYADALSPRSLRRGILEWAPSLVRDTADPVTGATATLSASAPVLVAHSRVYGDPARLWVPKTRVGVQRVRAGGLRIAGGRIG